MCILFLTTTTNYQMTAGMYLCFPLIKMNIRLPVVFSL